MCNSDDALVNVKIKEVPVAIATNSSPVCSGTSFELYGNDVANAEYNWYNNNSGVPGSLISTNKNVIQTMPNGTHTYYLALELDGCVSDTVSTTATVSEILAVPNVPADFDVCEESEITLSTSTLAQTYNWTGPNGFSSDDQSPFVITSAQSIHAGTYHLSVTIDGCGSATNSVTVGVNEKPETPFINSNAPVCENETVIMSAQMGEDSYTWYLPNGNKVSSTSENYVINSAVAADAGKYKVQATTNGCNSDWSDFFNLEVDEIPVDVAYAGSDVLACSEVGVQIAANATDYEGRWTTNSYTVQIVSPTEPVTLLKNIQVDSVYTFTWTLSNGACKNFTSDEVRVKLAKAPIANVDYLETSSDNSVENAYLLANDSLWNEKVNFYIVDDPINGNIKINPDQTIDYIPDYGFTGNDEFIYEICLDACRSLCDTAMVYTNTEAYIEIPDIITPNDDGENDFLIITGLENYPDNEIYIYNRWGKEVYHTVDYKNNWKGTYKGQDLPVGTYFYVFIDRTNGRTVEKGYITLHR